MALAEFYAARLGNEETWAQTRRAHRDVAAKWAILAEYTSPQTRLEHYWALETVVRHLATAHDDHADYDPRWKP